MDDTKAREILLSGELLYSETSDDRTHIAYAIGAVLHFLDATFEDVAVATLVEIGKDSKGYFVSFPTNNAPDEIEQ